MKKLFSRLLSKHLKIKIHKTINFLVDLYGLQLDMHTKFWSQNLKGRDQSEDIRLYGKIILEWLFGDQRGKVWTGCI
jgi:hypothetical protein